MIAKTQSTGVKRDFHFISGLPRSGSTLLAAILSQNPRFQAGMTSPLASLWGALLPRMSGASEFGSFFDDKRRRRILSSVMEAYHPKGDADQVVFDTNRAWTGRMAMIADVCPDARLICCVRDIGWIINSVERALRKSPLQTARIFNLKPGHSIYSRVEILMNSETGLIGGAWSTLREAWYGEFAERMVLVDYNSLTGNPVSTLAKLYEFIGEPLYPHDFEHVGYKAEAYDADLGIPGMHEVDGRVRNEPPKRIIPPDVFEKYNAMNFWRSASPTSAIVI